LHAARIHYADTSTHPRSQTPATSGTMTSVAGTSAQSSSGDNDHATSAAIDSPTGLALDASNNLYLADTHNHRIRRIEAATGIITTIAGTGTAGCSGDTTTSTTAPLALPHA